MSTLSTNWPTLADYATRLDPNGKIATLIELLNQTNPVLEDIPWVEGNLPTGHKTTIRSGLPAATWRLLNYGVQPSKSTSVQVVDTCGMLEAYAEVDKALVTLNGNGAAFRLSEDRAFIESMNQTHATSVFYGNSATDPEQIMGLTPRFNAKTGAENSGQIIDAGGTSTGCQSIWLVVWGPNTVHGIYPRGSTAGLDVEDLGQVTLTDANGGRYEGYRTHYKWDCGLTVRDWRYVVRIANIKTSALTKNPGALTVNGGNLDVVGGADLIDLMTQAIELIPNLGLGRPVFYVSRGISSFLRRQAVNKVINSTLSLNDIAGRKILTFDGIPVRRTDALVSETGI